MSNLVKCVVIFSAGAEALRAGTGHMASGVDQHDANLRQMHQLHGRRTPGWAPQTRDARDARLRELEARAAADKPVDYLAVLREKREKKRRGEIVAPAARLSRSPHAHWTQLRTGRALVSAAQRERSHPAAVAARPRGDVPAWTPTPAAAAAPTAQTANPSQGANGSGWVAVRGRFHAAAAFKRAGEGAKRYARDGNAYTQQEFKDFFNDNVLTEWKKAAPASSASIDTLQKANAKLTKEGLEGKWKALMSRQGVYYYQIGTEHTQWTAPDSASESFEFASVQRRVAGLANATVNNISGARM